MSTAILIRVDRSGQGDFKKIQDAIDSVPSNNPELVFIWVSAENTFASGGKAAAQRVSGDRAAFYGCGILSFRDTLLDGTGSHYCSTCYIEGATDFICGNAASLFEVSATFYVLLLSCEKIIPGPSVYVREGDGSSECHQQCENTTFIFIGMEQGNFVMAGQMDLLIQL
ncbi:putative pectinesterase 11 [Populus trichocarpa]|uniref:putative pectinesterase 11 n=1 Tax=Populus trichocarpa TaxID=3694 RepID=UPI002278B08F|nr:putative pectinesterase 11 [Populus trichocarpa]